MPRLSDYRLVIDTNILISAIIVAGSKQDNLLKLWQDDYYSLIITQELIEEMIDVCSRAKFKEKYKLFSEKAAELIDNLKLSAELVIPIPERELSIHCRDPKDDKLLACAIGGNATHLVTGDEDLLILRGNSKLGDLAICTTKAFLDLFYR